MCNVDSRPPSKALRLRYRPEVSRKATDRCNRKRRKKNLEPIHCLKRFIFVMPQNLANGKACILKKTHVSLDVLNQIDIASPCPANWHEMTGDAQKRHCEHCDLDVYNLSAMTRQEATDLLTSPTTAQCVRVYRRQDGSVITRDCPWRERVKMRTHRWVAALIGLFGIGWAAAVGCIMGARAYPPTVTMGDRGPQQTTPDRGNSNDRIRVVVGRTKLVEEVGATAPPAGKQPEYGQRYETRPPKLE